MGDLWAGWLSLVVWRTIPVSTNGKLAGTESGGISPSNEPFPLLDRPRKRSSENGISNMARPRVESTLFPSWTELPVEWNNLDVFQHVNNTHFIRWFESARVAYLQQCKLDSWMQNEGMGPIISSIICHYRRPVLFPDTVRIGARVKHLGRSNMVLYHAVFSIQTERIVADGESHVVLFDRNRSRPVRISDSSRELIEKFEATAVEICKVDL